jgi:hypothetical protein
MSEKKAYSAFPGFEKSAMDLNNSIVLAGSEHKETDRGVFGRGKISRSMGRKVKNR